MPDMSNYPPGVTGNEYAIAGPDHELERDAWCNECEAVMAGVEQWYRRERWWTCDTCGWTTETPQSDATGTPY